MVDVYFFACKHFYFEIGGDQNNTTVWQWIYYSATGFKRLAYGFSSIFNSKHTNYHRFFVEIQKLLPYILSMSISTGKAACHANMSNCIGIHCYNWPVQNTGHVCVFAYSKQWKLKRLQQKKQTSSIVQPLRSRTVSLSSLVIIQLQRNVILYHIQLC